MEEIHIFAWYVLTDQRLRTLTFWLSIHFPKIVRNFSNSLFTTPPGTHIWAKSDSGWFVAEPAMHHTDIGDGHVCHCPVMALIQGMSYQNLCSLSDSLASLSSISLRYVWFWFHIVHLWKEMPINDFWKYPSIHGLSTGAGNRQERLWVKKPK